VVHHKVAELIAIVLERGVHGEAIRVHVHEQARRRTYHPIKDWFWREIEVKRS
jgi:hypothetical protein